MSVLAIPTLRVFYEGVPATKARIHTYATGTTTKVATYADAALAEPNPNPVVCDAGGEAVIYADPNQVLRLVIETAGGTLIRDVDPVYPVASIDTSTATFLAGSVGIGTTTPIRKLTVSDATEAAIVLQDRNQPADQQNLRMYYSGGIFIIGNLNDAGTAGTTPFGLDPITGHVYFNQFGSPGPGISNTLVGGSIYNDGANGVALALSRGNQSPLFLNTNVNGIVSTYQRSGSTVGSVTVTTTATSFNTSSDYRLKENLTPLADAVGRIEQIPVYRGNFKATPDITEDLILAHEMQEVIPLGVHGEKDGEHMQTVDKSYAIPLMIAAIQELAARVAALEANS